MSWGQVICGVANCDQSVPSAQEEMVEHKGEKAPKGVCPYVLPDNTDRLSGTSCESQSTEKNAHTSSDSPTQGGGFWARWDGTISAFKGWFCCSEGRSRDQRLAWDTVIFADPRSRLGPCKEGACDQSLAQSP